MARQSSQLINQPEFRRLVALCIVLGMIAPLAAWQPPINYLATLVGLIGILAVGGSVVSFVVLVLWSVAFIATRNRRD